MGRELGSGHWLYQSEDTWTDDGSKQEQEEQQQMEESEAILSVQKTIDEDQAQIEEAEAEGMTPDAYCEHYKQNRRKITKNGRDHYYYKTDNGGAYAHPRRDTGKR